MTLLILDNHITFFLNGEIKNTLKASKFILNQTYNATLVLLDYYHVHAHALSKLLHLMKSSDILPYFSFNSEFY